jgi:hypothetical protein
MGVFQENIGTSTGMAFTAAAYIVGGLVYVLYVDKYYSKLMTQKNL